MIYSALLFLCLSLGVRAQLNPLGRFGKCIDVDTEEASEKDLEGTWYLQYRFRNPDHDVHSCQGQYEQRLEKKFVSLLYYYNEGKMVNAPQTIYYQRVSEGVYKRGITVDDKSVYVYMNILRYDPELKYRLIYTCTDHDDANPNIFNVAIATRDQEPSDMDAVLESVKKVQETLPPQLREEMDQVYQKPDRCEPLNVTKRDV